MIFGANLSEVLIKMPSVFTCKKCKRSCADGVDGNLGLRLCYDCI